LRTLEGIPESWVDEDRLGTLLDAGLLERCDRNVVPTERGMLLLNELVLAIAG